MVRIAEPARDYGAIADMRSAHEGVPITAAELERRDADMKQGATVYRFVADEDGVIAGTGFVAHSIWRSEGVWDIGILVASLHRRHGHGSAMLEFGQAIAERAGAVEVRCNVREEDSASLDFGEGRGYSTLAHSYESTLDLSQFDRALPDCGLPIISFAESPMGEREQRKLWVLHTETAADEPQFQGYAPKFEDFVANVIGASWFDPAGQFFAVDGDDWVGTSAISRYRPGECYNLFTGVFRSHRGRGIAKALKVRSCNYAKSLGIGLLRTHNDSRNAPMIAINKWLGYVPEPGWIVLTKSLSG